MSDGFFCDECGNPNFYQTVTGRQLVNGSETEDGKLNVEYGEGVNVTDPSDTAECTKCGNVVEIK